jgi:hypothetical protein
MSVRVTAIRIVGVAVGPVVRVAVAAVIVIGAVVRAGPVAKSADETPVVVNMSADPSIVIEAAACGAKMWTGDGAAEGLPAEMGAGEVGAAKAATEVRSAETATEVSAAEAATEMRAAEAAAEVGAAEAAAAHMAAAKAASSHMPAAERRGASGRSPGESDTCNQSNHDLA